MTERVPDDEDLEFDWVMIAQAEGILESGHPEQAAHPAAVLGDQAQLAAVLGGRRRHVDQYRPPGPDDR